MCVSLWSCTVFHGGKINEGDILGTWVAGSCELLEAERRSSVKAVNSLHWAVPPAPLWFSYSTAVVRNLFTSLVLLPWIDSYAFSAPLHFPSEPSDTCTSLPTLKCVTFALPLCLEDATALSFPRFHFFTVIFFFPGILLFHSLATFLFHCPNCFLRSLRKHVFSI